jgi:hypothetical protein
VVLAAFAAVPSARGQSSGAGDAGASPAPNRDPVSSVRSPSGLPEAPDSEVAALRREIAALRSLERAELPEGVDLFDLFVVDLTDAGAARARVEELRRTVRLARTRIEDAIAQTSSVAATELRVLTTTTSSAAAALPRAAETVGVEQARELYVSSLRMARDRLRIRVLSLPLETRESLASAERARSAIQREGEAARQVQLAAEAEAKAAEAQRLAALEEARRAASVAERALAAEEARVAALAGRIAERKGATAAERQSASTRAATRLARYEAWARSARAPEVRGDAADAMYRDIVSSLSELRAQARRQLSTLLTPTDVPRVDTRLDVPARLSDDLVAVRDQLTATVERLRDEAEAVRAQEIEARWEKAEALALELEALNDLRLELIPRLSADFRDDILGFTAAGFAQLRREVDQLELTVRWYGLSTARSLRRLPARLLDAEAVGELGAPILSLLALLVVGVVVARRYERAVGALRTWALARLRGRAPRAFVRRWLSFLIDHGRVVGLLVFAYAFFALVEPRPEVVFARSLVLGYGWYRLILAVVHYALVHGRAGTRRAVSAPVGHKIVRSTRLVGRYVFFVYVLLVLSKQVLGGGYLFRLVVGFSWIGAVPIALGLLRWWRDDIASAYLELYPEGRFAEAIRSTRGRFVGFFVACLAFGAVAAQGISSQVAALLMGFDQTRRALALLFRRRLERRAEAAGRGTVDLDALPPAVLEAFREEPVEEPLQIEHWPQMEKTLASVQRWLELEDETMSVAVTGERGSGKTSWLARLAESLESLPDLPVTRLVLEKRLTTRDALVRHLSEVLELEDCANEVSLAKRLLSGPRRAIVIDLGQQLMIRAVGGTAGYQAFTDLVARTSHHVLWVVSFSKFAWAFIDQRYQGRNLFSNEVHLKGWSEAEIAELIRGRMRAAGIEANFEEVVLDQWYDTEADEGLERTSDRFLRLLWDQSDGNPRIAIHFWKRSLIPDGPGKVRVRLFPVPDVSSLEELEEETRFVLASVVIHENLTLSETVKCLGYPANVCQAALAHLRGKRFLFQERGRYQVPTVVYRDVIRYLVRNNLIQN